MPITPNASVSTQSGAMPMMPMGGGGSPFNMSLPGYQGQAMPQNLGINFDSIQRLIGAQPQSLSNSMLPGFMQILGLQGNSMMPFFQNQTSQNVAAAQSDAMKRGLTGSTIEAGAMGGARAAGDANINQFMAQQLGQLGSAYQGAQQYDVGNQNQMYQNMAQAIGQQMAAQQAMQMFQQQMEQQRNLASDANRNALWGAGIGAAGTIGAGAMKMSDIRVKYNIKPEGTVAGLPCYSFEYKRDAFPTLDLPPGRRMGFMAQDVEKVYPECVSEVSGFKAIDYWQLAKCVGGK